MDSKNHLNIALSQVGVKEIVGRKHNPIIVNYAKEIGHSWVTTDETAWCSIFANWVAKKSGLKHSNKLNARSWLKVGVKVEKPEIGDVAVFWRGSREDWRGHVAFYISETRTHIYVLGGNQRNSVCIMAYPKYRLLEYRKID